MDGSRVRPWMEDGRKRGYLVEDGEGRVRRHLAFDGRNHYPTLKEALDCALALDERGIARARMAARTGTGQARARSRKLWRSEPQSAHMDQARREAASEVLKEAEGMLAEPVERTAAAKGGIAGEEPT